MVTNNADKQVRIYQWARKIKNSTEPYADLNVDIRKAAEFILEHIDIPTMANIEWDHEEHHLAGATDLYGNDVVMLSRRDEGIITYLIDPYNMPYLETTYNPEELILNGKMYRLTESK